MSAPACLTPRSTPLSLDPYRARILQSLPPPAYSKRGSSDRERPFLFIYPSRNNNNDDDNNNTSNGLNYVGPLTDDVITQGAAQTLGERFRSVTGDAVTFVMSSYLNWKISFGKITLREEAGSCLHYHRSPGHWRAGTQCGNRFVFFII